MNLDAAKGELEVRLYRWALEQWKDELNHNFRLLRLVHGNAARKTLQIFESLSSTELWPLARALTKRFHVHATERLGEPLSTEEAMLLTRCDAVRLEAPSLRPPSPGNPTHGRRQLVDRLKRELAFLGQAESLGSYAEWRYVTIWENWQLGTYLDAGGRFGDCSYFHTIETSRGTSLIRYLSLLSWLGVSSETKWRVIEVGDAEKAARGMAALCQHFRAEVPRLLDALGVDS